MALRRVGARELKKLLAQSKYSLGRGQWAEESRAFSIFDFSLTRREQKFRDWKDVPDHGEGNHFSFVHCPDPLPKSKK